MEETLVQCPNLHEFKTIRDIFVQMYWLIWSAIRRSVLREYHRGARLTTTRNSSRTQGDIDILQFLLAGFEHLVTDCSIACGFAGSRRMGKGWRHSQLNPLDFLQAHARVKIITYKDS